MNEKIKNLIAPANGWKIPLFAAAVLLTIQAAGFGLRTAGLEKRVAETVAAQQSMAKAAKDTAAASAKVPENMKKQSLFAPPSQKQLPVCLGLLGDRALIGDKWYRAGDTAGAVKIISVGAKDVTILLDGAEKKIVPFDAAVNYASGQPKPSPAAPPSAPTSAAPPAAAPLPQMRLPQGMTPEMMQKLREQFRNMTPEQRRRRSREFGERGE